jgi:hypothetical protein
MDATPSCILHFSIAVSIRELKEIVWLPGKEKVLLAIHHNRAVKNNQKKKKTNGVINVHAVKRAMEIPHVCSIPMERNGPSTAPCTNSNPTLKILMYCSHHPPSVVDAAAAVSAAKFNEDVKKPSITGDDG